MMQLQSQISRKYGDSEYRKFWVVVPSKVVKLLGWKTGQKLEGETKDGKLVIEKRSGK